MFIYLPPTMNGTANLASSVTTKYTRLPSHYQIIYHTAL